jgi:hypothetical protein
VFADRYLPWSCLFWLGLALQAFAGMRLRGGWRALAFAGSTGLVLLLFAPSHRAFAGWSATVYRHLQQSAVAAQLGIWDAERFPDGPDASRADVLDTLDRLRSRHLSMFAEPAFAVLQPGAWHAPAERPPMPADAAALHRVDAYRNDPRSPHPCRSPCLTPSAPRPPRPTDASPSSRSRSGSASVSAAR